MRDPTRCWTVAAGRFGRAPSSTTVSASAGWILAWLAAASTPFAVGSLLASVNTQPGANPLGELFVAAKPGATAGLMAGPGRTVPKAPPSRSGARP